jgi:hypothetical protein
VFQCEVGVRNAPCCLACLVILGALRPFILAIANGNIDRVARRGYVGRKSLLFLDLLFNQQNRVRLFPCTSVQNDADDAASPEPQQERQE